MSEKNKALVRRLIEELYNRGNLAAVDDLFASDLVVHAPSEEIHGRAGVRQYVGALRTGFPDIRFAIEEQIAEGDRVMTRWTARGTHTGEFWGIPPTGKQVCVTGAGIDRLADGKSVECWTYVDELGLLLQLGVMPAPQPAGD